MAKCGSVSSKLYCTLTSARLNCQITPVVVPSAILRKPFHPHEHQTRKWRFSFSWLLTIVRPITHKTFQISSFRFLSGAAYVTLSMWCWRRSHGGATISLLRSFALCCVGNPTKHLLKQSIVLFYQGNRFRSSERYACSASRALAQPSISDAALKFSGRWVIKQNLFFEQKSTNRHIRHSFMSVKDSYVVDRPVISVVTFFFFKLLSTAFYQIITFILCTNI